MGEKGLLSSARRSEAVCGEAVEGIRDSRACVWDGVVCCGMGRGEGVAGCEGRSGVDRYGCCFEGTGLCGIVLDGRLDSVAIGRGLVYPAFIGFL